MTTDFREGDTVEVTIVGVAVDSPSEHVYLDNGVALWTGTPGITFRKIASPRPKTGDKIDGKTLKETEWRAGTVIRFMDDSWSGASDPSMLKTDGQWHGTMARAWDRFESCHVDDEGQIELLFVPE